ncbi:MAG: DUF4330 domain-containing protein [Clostridia bacterium]|nr:DUF4330 domain-containing protein [Clostridia bacterium]
MKLINEKGKLFGLINLVDLGCILIVVLLAAGLGWKLLGNQVQTAVAPTTTMTTTMRVRGVYPYAFDDFANYDFVGEKLVMGTGFVDAVITDVAVEPYHVQNVTADGDLVPCDDPERVDIVFTVESQVPSGSAVYKIGTQEVRMGRTFILKTDIYEANAIIESVVIAE